MTDTNIIATIEMAVNDGDTRDTIIIKLVTDYGISIDKATKEYASYAKDNGLTKAIVSHKVEALEWLTATYPTADWTANAVKAAIIDLMDAHGVAESTARDYCKAYSKQLGMASIPMVDPRQAIFAWFLNAGLDADKQDFIDYAMLDLGRSRSNANEYWKGYELHCFLVANA